MGAPDRNLYRIDELLLRTGAVAVVFAIALTGVIGAFGASIMGLSHEGMDFGTAALGLGALALVWSAPAGLLAAGYAMRQQEKRIVALWDLFKRSGEVRVKPLLANSDFRREDVDRAVRFLNTRGLGHYLWDRATDTVRDARLHDSMIHFEICDACEAEISIEVPIAATTVPRCPFCSDPVSVVGIEERRRKVLAEVRGEARPVAHAPQASGSTRAERARKDFSIGLFLFLLVAFWPAALGYAYYKWEVED